MSAALDRMRELVFAALDEDTGLGRRVMADNSMTAAMLLTRQELGSLSRAERIPLGDVADQVAAWKRDRNWKPSPEPPPSRPRQGRLL